MALEITGSLDIDAPPKRVWAGLNDPALLRRLIPHCERLERVSPTELKATVSGRVGPIRLRLSGRITIHDAVPPQSYRLSGAGEGGLAGFARGTARVRLTPLDAAPGPAQGEAPQSHLHDAPPGGSPVAGPGIGGESLCRSALGTRTRLDYAAGAEFSGRLAMLGHRLVAGAARRFADRFLAAFASAVAAAAREAEAAHTALPPEQDRGQG